MLAARMKISGTVMDENKDFLRQDNNYRTLKAFQKAECIYDVTFYFAHQFLKAGDRTIDQNDTGCPFWQAEPGRGQHRLHHLARNGAEADQCEPRLAP